MQKNLLMTLSLFFLVASFGVAQDGPTAYEFSRFANQVLPLEEPYTYHKRLKEGPVHQLSRDPQTTKREDEMGIPDRGWQVLIRSDSGAVLRHAAQDFSDFLRVSMGVTAPLSERSSLAEWKEAERSIVVGTSEQLPGCGEQLTAEKDYRLVASDSKLLICGDGERGAAFGLYNLEARMNLREGPFLPSDLDVVRHSIHRTRMVLNWMGWMEWPDNYLAHLAHDGFDAIYASVYANPNGAEGPSLRASDLYSRILARKKEQSAERVHDLVERAEKFGVKVYTPIIFRYTGEPENEAELRQLVRDIVTEFPKIAGYILLTEGFYYDNWFGAGGHGGADLLEWARSWVEGVAIVTEECHRINPGIEVLAWEYNIDFRPQRADLKRQVIELLPADTIPFLTWENGKSFELDGYRGYLRDYSINMVGPSEVTQAQIEAAKKRGMTVYSKADTFASWQFGTTPYIPAPYQWHQRYKALEEYGVDGTHESWSNGYKPNFIVELRAWYSWTEAPPLDELLRKFARRDFGSGSEDLVLEAWTDFSEAIRKVPDTGPSMGTNYAVGNPLFFEEGPPRTMTLEHSWSDPVKWQGYAGGSIIPHWPYAARFLTFFPDFSNRENKAESYAKSRSGIGGLGEATPAQSAEVLSIFKKYLLLAADGFEKGLKSYRRAALQAPPSDKEKAVREVLIVEQMQRMLRSSHAILTFEDLRFNLAHTEDKEKKRQILREMTEILGEEILRTDASLEAARRDSRLGYEFEQDYIYSPYVLEEKLRVLRKTLTELIPNFRREQGL